MHHYIVEIDSCEQENHIQKENNTGPKVITLCLLTTVIPKLQTSALTVYPSPAFLGSILSGCHGNTTSY